MNRRDAVALLATASLALTGCEPVQGTPSGKQPKPAPDPHPAGSAGRDEKSVLLYVSWEHEYEKIIGYQDGTLTVDRKPRHEFDQRAQTATGGSVSIPAAYKPDTVFSISADPKRERENRGLTTCWILWNNKIQDRDTKTDGSVECTWRAP